MLIKMSDIFRHVHHQALAVWPVFPSALRFHQLLNIKTMGVALKTEKSFFSRSRFLSARNFLFPPERRRRSRDTIMMFVRMICDDLRFMIFLANQRCSLQEAPPPIFSDTRPERRPRGFRQRFFLIFMSFQFWPTVKVFWFFDVFLLKLCFVSGKVHSAPGGLSGEEGE